MRLIDKDRLLKGSNHYWLEMENFGDIESIDVRFVEMAEEVKAIPIEWIKNYAKRKASKGFTEIDCYWQYWEEDVLKMVADWEKENEQNKENASQTD